MNLNQPQFQSQYIAWLDTLRITNVSTVGGKNASLGEMISMRWVHPCVILLPYVWCIECTKSAPDRCW